jgi:dienelactone hydrolase
LSSPSLVETYLSYPEDRSTKHGVIILTDVIGHRFINSQLIADQFAANGYFVAMPDLFHGDPVKLNRPASFKLMTWLEGHPTERVDPVVDSVITHMRTYLGCEKVGAVGYCFGVCVRKELAS